MEDPLAQDLAAALRGLSVGDGAVVEVIFDGRLLTLRRDDAGFVAEAAGHGLDALGRHGFALPTSGWSRLRRSLPGTAEGVAAEIVALLRDVLGVRDTRAVRLRRREAMSLATRLAMAAAFVVIFGLPLALVVGELPPASWLMALERRWLGAYHPMAIFAVLLVALVLALVPLLALAARMPRRRA